MTILEEVTALQDKALSNVASIKNLQTMCDRFGHRLSGSDALERTLDWLEKQLKQDRFDHVVRQPVWVPVWVRGNESAVLLTPRSHKLAMLGLGGSIGTGKRGLEAAVIPVTDFADLQRKAKLVDGNIVLFNVPFTSYGETVSYRVTGAVAAARCGAVAAIIRSVGPASLSTPHTGSMSYSDGVTKIPTCAVSIEDATLLERLYTSGYAPRVRLKMDAHMKPDRKSSNIWAEVKGSTYPDEVIAVGGHIDSWDVGQGAQDDGGGCCAAWEALKQVRVLGQPKRTIRVVFWVNEENGTRGADAYAKHVAEKKEVHRLLIESDIGITKPLSIGISTRKSGDFQRIAKELEPLLRQNLLMSVVQGGGGADIGPTGLLGYPTAALNADTDQYWNLHHTNADTFDKINPADFRKCVAALATVAWWASASDVSI